MLNGIAKRILGAAAPFAATLVAAAVPAHAAPVIWTFQNAGFDDGGRITGSFVWDAAATNAIGFAPITQFSIQVTKGDRSVNYGPGLNFIDAQYTTADATGSGTGVRRFPFPFPVLENIFTFRSTVLIDPRNPFASRGLQIAMQDELTDAGGQVEIDTTSGFTAECWACAPFRLFTPGSSVFGVPMAIAGIPEPTTWAMAIVGVGFAGGNLRRTRRRQSRATANACP